MAYPKDGNRRYLIPSQEGETRIEADCEYGAWLECAVLTLRSPSPPPTPSVRTPRAKALAHRSGTRPSRPHRTSSAQHGNKPHKPGQKHIPPKPVPARSAGKTTGQQITAQSDAGMPAERIGQIQQDISAHLLNEARIREGRAFASEYDWAAETLVHELRQMERRPGPELEAAG